MRIGDLTQRPVVTTEQDAYLAEAAQRMCERGIGSLLVVDGDVLVGVITERDILTAVGDGAVPEVTPVADYMSDDPLVVTPDMDVDGAAALMVENGYRHLPVVLDGTPLGMISMRDVLEARDGDARPAR